MQVFALLPLLATLLSASSGVSAHPGVIAAHPPTCAKETVVSETFIGQDKNVKLEYSRCDDAPYVSADGHFAPAKRQTSSNVCGAPCKPVPARPTSPTH